MLPHSAPATHKPQSSLEAGELVATATAGAAESQEEVEDETAVIRDESQDLSAEIEPLKQATSPILPPAAEVEQHRLTHWPYRSWCKFCNLGRGIGEQHRREGQKVRHVPIVGLDY